MKNHNNRVVVWYPGKGLRVRSCQTTVFPQGYKRHTTVTAAEHVKNFNSWAVHIRRELELMVHTGQAQIDEAKRLINNSSKVKALKK